MTDVLLRFERVTVRRGAHVVLEDLSFDAPDLGRTRFVVDGDFVRKRLAELAEDEDLSRYIL